jgi:hypothetical protein
MSRTGTYEFRCGQCTTTAFDWWRSDIEHFTAHHMETAHTIRVGVRQALPVPLPKRRRWPSSQPLSTKRRAVPVGDRGQQ